MTSGQQDLISGARRLAEKLVKKGKVAVIPPNVIASVEEALFGPWLYKDSEHPLGWDPNTQRIHALRNKAPTNDTAGRSVAAAVFLATQALPLFPCFARGGRLMTTGFYRDGDDQEWFEWPIWRAPLAIDALRSLVARPFTADLKLCGVDVVYHCPRIRSPGSSEGNYRVFGHASERLWPAGAAGEAVSLQQR